MSLSELSRRSQLPHPTVLRLTSQLAAAGLIARDSSTRRFRLGPTTFELGLAAQQHDVRSLFAPTLQRLSKLTSAPVTVCVRSGDESVCVDRCLPEAAAVPYAMEPGMRRALGTCASGLVMLAAMSQDERDEALARIRPVLTSHWDVAEDDLNRRLATARYESVSVVHGWIAPGVTEVAIAVRSPDGTATASISVAGPATPAWHSRIAVTSDLLLRAQLIVEGQLENARWRAPAHAGLSGIALARG